MKKFFQGLKLSSEVKVALKKMGHFPQEQWKSAQRDADTARWLTKLIQVRWANRTYAVMGPKHLGTLVSRPFGWRHGP